MKIAICTFAYKLAGELQRMIGSIGAPIRGDEYHYYVGLHSMQADVLATLDRLQRYHRMDIFRWGFNRGLAKGMNDLLLNAFNDGCDLVVYSNDDCIWGESDVHKLAREAWLQRDNTYAVSAFGYSGREIDPRELSTTAIAFNRLALEKIGMFDENFFRAYGEDIDYLLRGHLLGLKRGVCTETSLYHMGSASIATYDEDLINLHNRSFQGNADYFKRKWGGDYNSPVYDRPFNNPVFGYKIDEIDRERPYANYNRVDQAEFAAI